MVQNNKVLTVSYGTFSCTLEGFEDSFDTMKAIAEYFRDLAADDRYFGAEPPQPDADMLARIAQKEIARQVEARHDESGIHLRAAETATPAALAPAPQPEPEADEISDADVAQDVTAEETAEAEVKPQVTEEVAAEEPEAVEEPEVAEAEEAPEVIVVPPAEAEPVEAAAEEDEPEAEEAAPAEMQEEEATSAEAEEEPAQVEVEIEDVEAEIVEEEPEIVPAADSIAAKLQRIRAVVSRNDQIADEEDYSEDEHADSFMAQAASDITEALEEDDAAEAKAEDDGAEDDGIAEAIARIESAVESQEDIETAIEAPSEDLHAEPEEEPVAELSEEEDLFEDIDQDDDSDDLDDDDLTNILEDVRADIAAEKEASEEAPRQPRVLKVKRSDLEAAVAAGELEEITDTDEDAAMEVDDEGLSPEDEADLMRELAAVEAEMRSASDIDDDDLEELAEARKTPARQDRAQTRILDEEDETDVSRLMAEAAEKLDNPDSSTNRETYSHLRAAVAAAHAERSAGGTVGVYTDDDPYREDLASVVRPRRPTALPGPDTARRPSDSKPAPLKLVAEQRVDTKKSEPRGPIRPRRVTTRLVDEENPTGSGREGKGFAKFAQEAGATSLPELLEAAAAYLSFVEGHEQFSRPQLMNKVRQVENSNFNREDGLRSFGQLLREGKIEKTSGGRFTASGQIGFRPDERAAG